MLHTDVCKFYFTFYRKLKSFANTDKYISLSIYDDLGSLISKWYCICYLQIAGYVFIRKSDSQNDFLKRRIKKKISGIPAK